MVDHHPTFCAIFPFITGESYLRWMATTVWGKRLTLLRPDALDQEEFWKERLDNPSHVRPGLLLPRPVLWVSWWIQPLRSISPQWRQGSLLRWTQPSRSIFALGFVPFQDSRHARLTMVDSMVLLLLSRRQQLSRPEEYTGCYDDAQTNIVCKLTTGWKGDSHRLFLP